VRHGARHGSALRRARIAEAPKAPEGGRCAAAVVVSSMSITYRVCGNPRLTLLVDGSGQRLVTTFVRV
jgi:hypothetical protein